MFERFEIAWPLGAGLLIQPTGLAVLERLGVRTQAMLLGSRIDHLHGRARPNGPVSFGLCYGGLISDLHGLALHRASLFRLLHQAVSVRGIAIKHAAEIVALDQSGTRPALVDANGLRFGPIDLIIDARGRACAKPSAPCASAPIAMALCGVWPMIPALSATPCSSLQIRADPDRRAAGRPPAR
jgi:2-polyprenyl-6-methoxyphenol hydroxylase-like FAD-dependent oxidoreductase